MENKTYEPKEREVFWKEYWETEGIYKFESDPKKPSFTIDTPPPTVSGAMHIGHAFMYSIMDFAARYKRMAGYNVYFPFGTDDNGLPTERLVEKLKKVKSTRMQRIDFIKLCRETITEIKPAFVEDWKRIGMSCDFLEIYSTIDPHCIKTSQASFLDLYKKGFIYKKKSASMWCVQCQTAIAQAELEDKELASTFNDITFKTADGGEITIATTRPELLPACLAIFYHPDDQRYQHMKGKHAIVPIFGQSVPIIPDEMAQIDKGSGMLMICSYGDRFDADAIKRKNLEPRACITKDGKMNEHAKHFVGLPIKEARIAILKELEESGELKLKKNITHAVNVHDKCGTDIEFLDTEQWFIQVTENKQKFIDAGRKIKWYPESMRARYEHWVNNLNWDWCISRQRHFGVAFPVWYSKKTGEIILPAEEELPIDPLSQYPKNLPEGHTEEDIIPEKDVMDTWATSSVSPQIITNWVEDDFKSASKAVKFNDYFPTTLRAQGHDIIRTWAFYTIVKSEYHHNKIPWENIIVTGNIADPKGEKMSKSKGNIVAPNIIIDKYSSDILRFWAAGTKLGEDLAYQEKEFVTGKKLVTKMWNAGNFAFSHLENYEPEEFDFNNLEIIDKWLLISFSNTVKQATESFEKYNPNEARRALEQFFWHNFCDNYLEIAKYRLYDESLDEKSQKAKLSAKHTLYNVFLGILKISAPITCFISEELYSRYYKSKDKEGYKSIHLTKWPTAIHDGKGESHFEAGELAIKIIAEIRKYKAANQMSMKEELSEIKVSSNFEIENLSTDDKERLRIDILRTCSGKKILFNKSEEFKVEIIK